MSSDGKFHATLSEAQASELCKLLQPHIDNATGMDGISTLKLAHDLLGVGGALVDILTMKPNSLPKARKINGGTKKRTPKHIADQNVLPLEAK